MFPFRCNSQISQDESDEIEVLEDEEFMAEEEEEEIPDEYGLREKDRVQICAAFTLLDTDGDGVISPRTAENILVVLGREPVEENLEGIMKYCVDTGCDGKVGMSYSGFYNYIGGQLANTDDPLLLREAFGIFGYLNRMDDPVPEGLVDMRELRKYLKNYQMKLTDDELDYLWAEENYWMLDEKRVELEYLIKTIMRRD